MLDVFVRTRKDGVNWIVRQEYLDAVIRYSWPKATDEVEPLLWTRKGRTIYSVDLAGMKCVAKEFVARQFGSQLKGFLYQLKYRFVPPPALREWKVAAIIRAMGIPTPQPIAIGVRRRAGFLQSSLIVLEKLQGAITLESFMKTGLPSMGIAERRRFIRLVGRFYREIHSKGVFQRDFGWRNILIRPGGPEGFLFYLIDFEEVTLGSDIPLKDKLRGYSQLNRNLKRLLSRTDRLRLFRSYFNDPPVLDQFYRDLIQKIETYVAV